MSKRVQIKLEFIFRTSPAIIYQFLATPACLVRWFCDEVDTDGNYFTYSWNGYSQTAEVIDDIEEERLRLRWTDAEDEKEFFEFKIYPARVMDNETVLEITDFCDEDEVDLQKDLWKNQIEDMRRQMGGA